MKAREIIIQLVNTSVAPVLRGAGFRKSGFDFHRYRGEVVQAVNVQLSAANFGESGHFYINVGLNFDRVCLLEGKTINLKPKAYECMLRRRLEEMVGGVPVRWDISSQADMEGLRQPLRAACEDLLGLLDPIDSIDHFLAQDWKLEGIDLGLRAQMQYLVGNHEAAVEDLRLERAFFADRPNWDQETWLERRGLGELREKI